MATREEFIQKLKASGVSSDKWKMALDDRRKEIGAFDDDESSVVPEPQKPGLLKSAGQYLAKPFVETGKFIGEEAGNIGRNVSAEGLNLPERATVFASGVGGAAARGVTEAITPILGSAMQVGKWAGKGVDAALPGTPVRDAYQEMKGDIKEGVEGFKETSIPKIKQGYHTAASGIERVANPIRGAFGAEPIDVEQKMKEDFAPIVDPAKLIIKEALNGNESYENWKKTLTPADRARVETYGNQAEIAATFMPIRAIEKPVEQFGKQLIKDLTRKPEATASTVSDMSLKEAKKGIEGNVEQVVGGPVDVSKVPKGPGMAWGKITQDLTESERRILSEPKAEKSLSLTTYAKQAEIAKRNLKAQTPFQLAGINARKAFREVDGLRKSAGQQIDKVIGEAQGKQVDIADVKNKYLEMVNERLGNMERIPSDPTGAAVADEVGNFILSLPDQLSPKMAWNLKRNLQSRVVYTKEGQLRPQNSVMEGIIKQTARDIDDNMTKVLGKSFSAANERYREVATVSQRMSKVLGTEINPETGLTKHGASIMKRALESNADSGISEIFRAVNALTGGKYDLFQDASYASIAMRYSGDPRQAQKAMPFGSLIMAAHGSPVLEAAKAGAGAVANKVTGDKLLRINKWYEHQQTKGKTPPEPPTTPGGVPVPKSVVPDTPDLTAWKAESGKLVKPPAPYREPPENKKRPLRNGLDNEDGYVALPGGRPTPPEPIDPGPGGGTPIPSRPAPGGGPATMIPQADVELNRLLIGRLKAEATDKARQNELSYMEQLTEKIEKLENDLGKGYIWTEGLPIEEATYVKRGSPEETWYQSRLAAIRDEEAASRPAQPANEAFQKSRDVPRAPEQPAAEPRPAAVPEQPTVATGGGGSQPAESGIAGAGTVRSPAGPKDASEAWRGRILSKTKDLEEDPGWNNEFFKYELRREYNRKFHGNLKGRGGITGRTIERPSEQAFAWLTDKAERLSREENADLRERLGLSEQVHPDDVRMLISDAQNTEDDLLNFAESIRKKPEEPQPERQPGEDFDPTAGDEPMFSRKGNDFNQERSVDRYNDAEYLNAANEGNIEKAQKLVDDKLAKIGALWHGTPSGDLRGGRSGLHIGTKRAATEALEARIGIPADGRPWDGTRKYGETLLAGQELINRGKFGQYRDTGYNSSAPQENFYAKDHKYPTTGKDTPVDPEWKPWVRPVIVIGDMSNSKYSPMSDIRANATMAGNIKKGRAKKGFYYVNDAEDYGSVSAVLPNGEGVRVKLPDPITRDNDGKIIPLSERFNENVDDIRFSRKSPTPEQVAKASGLEYKGKWEGGPHEFFDPQTKGNITDTDLNRISSKAEAARAAFKKEPTRESAEQYLSEKQTPSEVKAEPVSYRIATTEKLSRKQKREAIREWKKKNKYELKDSSIDRGGAHSAPDPESGAPLYDLSDNGVYPEDVYSYNGLQYYGTGEDALDRQAYGIIQSIEGRPNLNVRIYRAIELTDDPTIKPGDWVSTVRKYVKDHGEGTLNGKYKIISKSVPARDLFTNGDSWLEYGYHPQKDLPYFRIKEEEKLIPDKTQPEETLNVPEEKGRLQGEVAFSRKGGDEKNSVKIILKAIEEDQRNYKNTGVEYGIRIHEYPIKRGDKLGASHDWDYENDTRSEDYLAGTSVLGLGQEPTISDVTQQLRMAGQGGKNRRRTGGHFGYEGDYIALVRGENSGYGADEGEVLLVDPVVLATFKRGSEEGIFGKIEGPAFSRKALVDADQFNLFGGSKTLSELEADEAKRLEKGEVSRRLDERKGGEADMRDLPMFENADIEGSQQTLAFSRKGPGSKKSVLDQLLTPQKGYEAIEISDEPLKGFILPDGKYLGVAGVSDEHRIINGLVKYSGDNEQTPRTEKMYRIMKDAGLVRFLPESNSFQFKVEPTRDQARAISRYIRDNGSAEVEFPNGRSNRYTEDNLFELEEDIERGNIAFSRKAADPFFSPTVKAVQGLKQERGTGEQMFAMITKTPGVKEAEWKWMGLDDFLKGKQSVTKGEIEEFVRQNQVRVEEVEKGKQDPIELKNKKARINKLGDEWDILAEEDGKWWPLQEGYISVDEAKTAEEALSKYKEDHKYDDTKFSQYSLPGGENYREVLLTMPGQTAAKEKVLPEWNKLVSDVRKRLGNETIGMIKAYEDGLMTPEETKTYEELSKVYDKEGSPEFTSSHWSEPNVVAHIRLNDRTGPDGEKVLFIEEIQSDWAREAREKGIKGTKRNLLPVIENNGMFEIDDPAVPSYTRTKYKTREDALVAAESSNKFADENMGVPAQPFLKNWEELTLKRVLRMAAEEGYDRVAWINGEQTAERYDLSKQVSKVVYRPESKNLIVYGESGNQIMDETVEPNEIEKHIGKEPARRLLEQPIEKGGWVAESIGDDWRIRKPDGKIYETTPGRTWRGSSKEQAEAIIRRKANIPEQYIEGEDLKIGGEWAAALYDRMIPKFYERYLKRFNSKIERYNISPDKGGSDASSLRSKDVGENLSIAITPEMKESVLYEGQPMFQRRGTPDNLPEKQFRPAKSSDQRAAQALAKPAGKMLGRDLTPDDIRAVEPFDPEARNAAAALRKITPYQVVFVKTSDAMKAAGIDFNGAHFGGRIFLNVDGEHPYLITGLHETLEGINKNHRDLMKPLLQHIKENLTPEGRKKAELRAIHETGKKTVTEADIDDAIKENAFDFGADQMSRPEWWTSLYEKSPQAVQKLIQGVIAHINKFLADLKIRKLDNSQHYKDAADIRDRMKAVHAEVLKREFGEEGAGKIAGDMQFMMKAYHGSPHKFEKFRGEKIGTGEGNQAFGHGLYFTNEKDIAESYATDLTRIDPDKVTYGGKSVQEMYDNAMKEMQRNPKSQKANAAAGFWENVEVRLHPKTALSQLEDGKHPGYKEFAESLDMSKFKGLDKGNVYSVTIHKGKTPDQYDYLKWDEPVSKKIADKVIKYIDAYDKNDLSKRKKEELGFAKYVLNNNLNSETGASVYGQISKALGSEKAGSEFLLRSGIDGIDYPAGSLSGVKSDARNYVVFDPEAVTIDERAEMSRKTAK